MQRILSVKPAYIVEVESGRVTIPAEDIQKQGALSTAVMIEHGVNWEDYTDQKFKAILNSHLKTSLDYESMRALVNAFVNAKFDEREHLIHAGRVVPDRRNPLFVLFQAEAFFEFVKEQGWDAPRSKVTMMLKGCGCDRQQNLWIGKGQIRPMRIRNPKGS